MSGHRVRILIEVDSDEPRELDVIDDPCVASVAACLRTVADRLECFGILRQIERGT